MSGNTGFYITLGVIVIIFAVLIYFQSRRRKTQQAEYTGMLDTLRAGVRVKTVGGVIGKIVEIREEAPGFKTVLLETGDEKHPSFVLYDIQAIYGIVNDDALAAANADKTDKTAQAQPTDITKHEGTDSGVNAPEDAFEAKKTKKKSQK